MSFFISASARPVLRKQKTNNGKPTNNAFFIGYILSLNSHVQMNLYKA
jgi:hypothetical protein